MKFTVIKNDILVPLLKVTLGIFITVIVFAFIIYGVWNSTIVNLCDNLNKMSRSDAALMSAVYMAFTSATALRKNN